jgi:SDR family mycofactocin-dependent oxidoreductase
MQDLQGQVAFITGGARGQGRSHALAFAEQGADIVICDLCENLGAAGYPLSTKDDLAETVALVEATGRTCLSAVADTRDPDAIDALVADAVERFGRIDILVANAGICGNTSVQKTTNSGWSEVLDTNLTGVFNSIRAVSGTMIKQRSGRIVAVASMMGRSATPNNVAYITSKWGVIGLVKASAQDLAGYGITVNAVAPGNIATPMAQNETLYKMVRPDLESPTLTDVEPVMKMLHVQPVAYLEASEVTDVISFLVSPAARHITGSVIDINAGASARYQ